MKSKSIIRREKIQRGERWKGFKERNYFTWFDFSPKKYNETDNDNSFCCDFLPWISPTSTEFEFTIGIGFVFWSLYFTHQYKHKEKIK